MKLDDYQKFVEDVRLPIGSKTEEIMAWGLGISGEAGDVAGCIKKTYIHKDDQIEGIKENLGDTIWYIAAICNYYGWKLEDIIDENYQKLLRRYPKGANFKDAKKKRVDWNEKH